MCCGSGEAGQSKRKWRSASEEKETGAGPGSCLAFVTSYSHGLTNDRQLFLGLHINHTSRRSDPNSLCLCLFSCCLFAGLRAAASFKARLGRLPRLRFGACGSDSENPAQQSQLHGDKSIEEGSAPCGIMSASIVIFGLKDSL